MKPTRSAAKEGAPEHLEPVLPTTPVHIRNVALPVLAVLGGVFLLRYAQELFIPIALSVLLAYMLDPFVTALERLRIARPLAAGVVIIALLGLGCYGAYALRHEAMTVIESLPEAAAKVRTKIQEARQSSNGAAGPLTKIQQAAKEIEKTAAETGPAKDSNSGYPKVQVQEPVFKANDYLWAGSVGVIGLIAQGILILFLVFFLLASGDLFKRKLVRIIGTKLSEKRLTLETLNEINVQVERFLLVQMATGAIVGIATGLALWAFGLHQPIIWGIAAGILNAVPYVGLIITIAGLALAAFLQFDSVAMTLQIVAAALLIHSLEAFLLTPWLMSRVARINGVAMFLSILFWSWLWGIIGMIVAVPLTMVIKTVCERLEGLQTIGDLLDET